MKKDIVDDRVSELETMIAFQDQTIADLSNELFVQQEKLNEIDRTLKALVRCCRENIPQADIGEACLRTIKVVTES
jgi:SlyX.